MSRTFSSDCCAISSSCMAGATTGGATGGATSATLFTAADFHFEKFRKISRGNIPRGCFRPLPCRACPAPRSFFASTRRCGSRLLVPEDGPWTTPPRDGVAHSGFNQFVDGATARRICGRRDGPPGAAAAARRICGRREFVRSYRYRSTAARVFFCTCLALGLPHHMAR